MTEFKFSCPQCRRTIQCDERYAGSQIQCPGCQKTIVVPPASPAANPQLSRSKRSAVRTILVASAALIVLVGLVAVGWHFFPGGPRLAGDWKMGGPYNVGMACHIRQSGKDLTFVNEKGDESQGAFNSKTEVIALDWEGGLTGKLVKNNTRINWRNGTWWVKAK
jgi:DNA-directed RNA polymerase subunit RPC12/RpoP